MSIPKAQKLLQEFQERAKNMHSLSCNQINDREKFKQEELKAKEAVRIIKVCTKGKY